MRRRSYAGHRWIGTHRGGKGTYLEDEDIGVTSGRRVFVRLQLSAATGAAQGPQLKDRLSYAARLFSLPMLSKIRNEQEGTVNEQAKGARGAERMAAVFC